MSYEARRDLRLFVHVVHIDDVSPASSLMTCQCREPIGKGLCAIGVLGCSFIPISWHAKGRKRARRMTCPVSPTPSWMILHAPLGTKTCERRTRSRFVSRGRFYAYDVSADCVSVKLPIANFIWRANIIPEMRIIILLIVVIIRECVV